MRGNIQRIKILVSLNYRIYRTFMKPNLYCCGILGHNFHNKRGVKRNIDWGSFNLPIMVFHHCFYSIKSCLIDDYIFIMSDERRSMLHDLHFLFPNRNLDFSISTSSNGQTFNGIEDKINSASFPKVTFSAFLFHISWKNLSLSMSGYIGPALFPPCMANNWTRC